VRRVPALPERTGDALGPAGYGPPVLAVVLSIGSLLLAYFVIRKGVHHGILDADSSRRAREARQRLTDAVHQGATVTDRPSDAD
jgi:hypothetical protein